MNSNLPTIELVSFTLTLAGSASVNQAVTISNPDQLVPVAILTPDSAVCLHIVNYWISSSGTAITMQIVNQGASISSKTVIVKFLRVPSLSS